MRAAAHGSAAAAAAGPHEDGSMYLEPADMEVEVESCMPFKVEVPDEALADLRERLRRTRFIDDFDRAGSTYGVSVPTARRGNAIVTRGRCSD
jgi:hypothetical protein